MQAIDFQVAHRSDAIPTGQCHDIQNTDWRTNQRTCFVIPPSGGSVPARNANNETREEALAACQYRCLHTGGSCVGLNVVPITAPPLLRFPNVSERALPWTSYYTGKPVVGVSNCNMSCFANEPNLAESMVCYPLRLAGTRIIEEDWTLSLDDPTNEIWYRCVEKPRCQRICCKLLVRASLTSSNIIVLVRFLAAAALYSIAFTRN